MVSHDRVSVAKSSPDRDYCGKAWGDRTIAGIIRTWTRERCVPSCVYANVWCRMIGVSVAKPSPDPESGSSKTNDNRLTLLELNANPRLPTLLPR